MERMNEMSNNDQWLYENMPRLQYSVNGIKRNSGVKILAGQTRWPAEPRWEYVGLDISFGSFFTPGCNPTVVATAAGSSSPHKKYVTTCSLGAAGNEVIDHRGFTAFVSQTPFQGAGATPLGNSGILHWIAVGL